MGYGGFIIVANRNKTFFRYYAQFFKPDALGVGYPSDDDQNLVGLEGRLLPVGSCQTKLYAVLALFEPGSAGSYMHFDLPLLEVVRQDLRAVGILVGQNLRQHLYQAHLRAE